MNIDDAESADEDTKTEDENKNLFVKKLREAVENDKTIGKEIFKFL